MSNIVKLYPDETRWKSFLLSLTLEAAADANRTHHHRQYQQQITNRKTNDRRGGNQKNPTSKDKRDDNDDNDPEHDRTSTLLTSTSVFDASINASNRATIDTVTISSSNFPTTPEDKYIQTDDGEDQAMKLDSIGKKKSDDEDDDVIQECDHVDDHSSTQNLDFDAFDRYSCRIDLLMEEDLWFDLVKEEENNNNHDADDDDNHE